MMLYTRSVNPIASSIPQHSRSGESTVMTTSLDLAALRAETPGVAHCTHFKCRGRADAEPSPGDRDRLSQAGS